MELSMNFLVRLADHFVRLQRQFGKKVLLGEKRYAVKGYISNGVGGVAAADWENELESVYVSALKAEGHFIDVGMNLGQTLGKILAIDPKRQYVGFEPQVFACAMVSTFIDQNGLTNCEVLPIALSNENGVRSFFSKGSADEMASLHDSAGAKKKSIVVRVGDDVIRELEIKSICAIKIDVEGAEPEVIKGLSQTIERFKPQIIFEVLPNYEGEDRLPVAEDLADQRRRAASEIMQMLNFHNYAVYQVLENANEDRIEAFDLDDPTSFAGTNYVARPL